MTDAVVLAEDLVAAGDESSSTVEVAVLSRDVIRSEAEDQVLQMLAEHDIAVPTVASAEGEYRMLLEGFAFWGLPAHHFVLAFWGHLADWDDQVPLDRELASLLDLQDAEWRPVERQVIEEQMRAVARASLATTALESPM